MSEIGPCTQGRQVGLAGRAYLPLLLAAGCRTAMMESDETWLAQQSPVLVVAEACWRLGNSSGPSQWVSGCVHVGQG